MLFHAATIILAPGMICEKNFLRIKEVTFPVTLALIIFCFIPVRAADPGAEIRSLINRNCVKTVASSVVVIDVNSPGSGEPDKILLSINGKTPIKAASLMKIFTTWSALYYLKPEYCFETEIHLEGDLEKGVLTGDLYVKGGGDPTLVPENMFLLTRKIHDKGIREIKGDIFLDPSGHVGPYRQQGWKSTNFHRAYSAPVYNLSYSYNAVSIAVDGTGEPGSKPKVLIAPHLHHLKIENNVIIRKKGGRNISVSVEKTEKGEVLKVNGTIPPGRKKTVSRCINRPDLFFGQAFRQFLEREGIKITGGLQEGRIPADSKPIVTYCSPPLSQTISLVNHYSNNFMAEMILRQLGGEKAGFPGSTEKGLAVVRDCLLEMNLDISELEQLDGSGLTRENRTSAMLLAKLLAEIYHHFEIGPEYLASLSSSGADGTFKKRLDDEENYRKMRGKSGLLNHVNNLCGYIQTKSGKTVVYVILLTDFRCSFDGIREIEHQICRWIREY